MVFFYQFVIGLVERYPELYSEQSSGETTEFQINFGKKWGNYSAVVELAGGNVNEIDEVVRQPLEKALLLLAYKADKIYLETLVHQAHLAKMNNQ